MALFKSKQQRELEAKMRIRQGMKRIQRFVKDCTKKQKQYWELGKRALRLGDREQFQQLAAAFLRMRENANRWERYLLQLETLNVRRDEVAATGEFMKSVSAMTNSILKGASPDQVASMQAKIEQAVAKSEALEEVLSMAMEASADDVFGTDELDDEKLEQLASQMGAEAEADESAAYDDRIAKGLKQIEDEMRKEL
jgi:hypothetical protein